MLATIKADPDCFQYINNTMRQNREVVQIAVQANGLSLKHALDKHRDDIEIVELAVKQNVFALQAASQRLRGDRKLVLRCIEQQPSTLRFASPELQNDPDICEFALRPGGTAYSI